MFCVTCGGKLPENSDDCPHCHPEKFTAPEAVTPPEMNPSPVAPPPPPVANTPPVAPPVANTPPVAPPVANTPPVAPPVANTPPIAPPAENTPPIAPPAENTPPIAPPAENIPAPSPVVPVDPQAQKKKKMITAACVVLFLVYSAWQTYADSPYLELVEYLEDENYTKAVQVYNSDIVDSTLWKSNSDKVLTAHIETLLAENEDDYDKLYNSLYNLSTIENPEIALSVSDNIEEVRAKENLKNTLVYADNMLENGNLTGAMDFYEDLIASGETSEEVTKSLKEVQSAYSDQVISLISTPKNLEEYEYSMDTINTALLVLPEDTKLMEKASEITNAYESTIKEAGFQEVYSHLESSNYPDALTKLGEMKLILPEDQEVSDLFTSTSTAYETYTMSRVEEQTSQANYDQALTYVKTALEVLPESSILLDSQSSILAVKPMKLSEVKLAESSRFELIEDLTVTMDSVGNMYDPGNLYILGSYYQEGYAQFYLGGAYTNFTFTLAASDNNTKNTNAVDFTIYGVENQILLHINDISRTYAATTHSVDVTGLEFLYIKTNVPSSYSVQPLLANGILTR